MITVVGPGHEPVPGRLALAAPGLLDRASASSGSLAKMLGVLFFFVWLRGTLPRFRYDQLMQFGWKVLVPVATPEDPADGGPRGWPRSLMGARCSTRSSSTPSRPWPSLSALVVVGQRNPIYSAFALIVTLCSLSAIFGLLGSPFIAVLQIVVYAGAIMVLFLFVLMLLSVQAGGAAPRQRPGAPRRGASAWARCCVLQVGAVLAGRRQAARRRRASRPRPREVAQAALLDAVPLRLRGHVGPDPGGPGGGRRPGQEGAMSARPGPARRCC